MKELLTFILKEMLGNEDFKIEESEDDGRIDFEIKTKKENIGLIIGKNGRIIKAIRNILKVRGTLEKKLVYLRVTEEL